MSQFTCTRAVQYNLNQIGVLIRIGELIKQNQIRGGCFLERKHLWETKALNRIITVCTVYSSPFIHRIKQECVYVHEVVNHVIVILERKLLLSSGRCETK